jgi:hypothetical protein
MLFEQKTKISDRYFVDNSIDASQSDEAFLYRVDVQHAVTSIVRHYLGWHSGQIEDVYTLKYFHSSTNSEFKSDLETSPMIVNNILYSGTKEEMATMETRMLKQVNAVKNPLYYNKSNGGGKFSKDFSVDLEKITKVFENSLTDVYPKTFYNKEKLNMLLSGGHFIQVRGDMRDDNYINELKLIFNGQKAEFTDPILMLMDKDTNMPGKIISGNQRTRAAINVATMNGLYAIEIPYNEWSNFTSPEIQAFGLMCNKQEGKTQKHNSYDDYANFVVNTIISEKLYTSKDKPMFNHPMFVDLFTSYGLNASQRGEITKRAKKLYAQRSNTGHNNNFVAFSDENVKKEPIVKKYYNSMTDLMKKLHPNATQIIKASSGNSIIAQIEKHIFVKNSTGKAIDVHKNVVLMIYHPKPGHKESNEWENTRSKWEFWRDKYLAPQGIHVSEIVLPTDRATLESFKEVDD